MHTNTAINCSIYFSCTINLILAARNQCICVRSPPEPTIVLFLSLSSSFLGLFTFRVKYVLYFWWFFLSFNLSAEIPFVFHIRSVHPSDDFVTFLNHIFPPFRKKIHCIFVCFKVFPPFRWRTFCISFVWFFSFFKRQLIYFKSYWNNTFLNIIDH